jgi:hypothetical protein
MTITHTHEQVIFPPTKGYSQVQQAPFSKTKPETNDALKYNTITCIYF